MFQMLELCTLRKLVCFKTVKHLKARALSRPPSFILLKPDEGDTQLSLSCLPLPCRDPEVCDTGRQLVANQIVGKAPGVRRVSYILMNFSQFFLVVEVVEKKPKIPRGPQSHNVYIHIDRTQFCSMGPGQINQGQKRF